jgi:hypothetical protein
MIDTEHTCHAAGCSTPVPPKMFMCRRHWFMLPKVMRDAVWATYVPGQEVRKDPSREYIDASTEAIRWLADYEAELRGDVR